MAIILSSERWNDTGIDLIKDQSYQCNVTGNWTDWLKESDADGYSNPLLDTVGFIKREKSAKWFQLIGVIDKKADLIIKLGTRDTFVSPASGRLWAYANDSNLFYGNNCGQVELHIHKLT